MGVWDACYLLLGFGTRDQHERPVAQTGSDSAAGCADRERVNKGWVEHGSTIRYHCLGSANQSKSTWIDPKPYLCQTHS